MMCNKILKTVFMCGFFASVIFTLTACEAVEGMGRDIQKAGQAIEKKAE